VAETDRDRPVRIRVDEGGPVLAELRRGEDGRIEAHGEGLLADDLRESLRVWQPAEIGELVTGYTYMWVEYADEAPTGEEAPEGL
jgi:hypothetical protein